MSHSVTAMASSPWFPHRHDADGPLLICFPYAGGTASAFRSWPALLPGCELAVAQLPGREGRIEERPLTSFDEIIGALLPELDDLGQRPCIIAGHCFGAAIAFRLAVALEGQGRPPAHLIVSGAVVPTLPAAQPGQYSSLDDGAFIAALATIHPRFAVVGEPGMEELRELMLPSWRADFEMGEVAAYSGPAVPLTIPLTVIASPSDPVTAFERTRGWEELTSGRTVPHQIESADHLFCHSEERQLTALIATVIDQFNG